MQESCREVFAWLRGGDATPDPEMENRFIDIIAQRVQSRLKAQEPVRPDKQVRGPAALSLKNIMEDCDILMSPVPQPREEPKAAYRELGIDSVTLARAFHWIAEQEGHSVNMSQLQTIMYIIYGVWLASKGERLTSEHPHVWQFGPVFPRVYNKLRNEERPGRREDYEDLKSARPELVSYMEKCFRKYGWTPAKVLADVHIHDGTPWAKARAESQDKWGSAISDIAIKDWFAAKLNK